MAPGMALYGTSTKTYPDYARLKKLTLDAGATACLWRGSMDDSCRVHGGPMKGP